MMSRNHVDAILDPRDTFADVAEWERQVEDLTGRFAKNNIKYISNEAGKAMVEASLRAFLDGNPPSMWSPEKCIRRKLSSFTAMGWG